MLEKNITRKLLSLSIDLFFKILLFPGCFPFIPFAQQIRLWYRVLCHHNIINFLHTLHNRQPIVVLRRTGMGFVLWLQTLDFLAATMQLYEWFSPSVCPSVCLSITPFWLCSHHRINMKFSGVITSDRSVVHAQGPGQRSKVKVTEVPTQLYRFQTVTPVWIHIWWWYDAYSLIMLRRGALLFFKVIHQISRSHGSKNLRIWPRLDVSGL